MVIYEKFFDFQDHTQADMIHPRQSTVTPVRNADDQFHWLILEKVDHLVNTVGTAEAFSTVYIQKFLAG